MKRKNWFGVAVRLLGLWFVSQGSGPAFAAGSVTNSFLTGRDLKTGGVLGTYFDDGRTVWDGVYLGEGSIAGGTAALNAAGASTIGADTTTFPGFLTVNSINGGWSGATDDGFFLYKLVQGDFDVSVQVVATFNNTATNFPGLMVRAYRVPDASRFSNSAAIAENWVGLWRLNELGLDGEIADNVNGARVEHTFPGGNTDTNSNRGLRIKRTGTSFFMFLSTNSGPWVPLKNASGGGNYSPSQGMVTRADFAGVPLQVGVVQPTFTANQAPTFFTDFELTNANIGASVAVVDPAGLTAAPAGSNTLVFSWTPGAGNDGSLLVIKKGGDPIDSQPADSFTFAGNTNYNFGLGYTVGAPTNTFLHHAGNWVAFVGPTNGSGTEHVAVSGFGNTNNVYYARVYGYKGAGTGTSYSKNPAGFSTSGFGLPQSLAASVSPTTNIPAGGATQITVTLVYTSGDSGDVTADPGISYTAGDPTVLVATNGTVSAIQFTNVNEQVVTQFGGPGGPKVTNNFSVHAPAFADNFAVSHDYVANGIAPSGWDGLFLNYGDVPNAATAISGPSGVPAITTRLDANLSANGMLTFGGSGGAWENNAANGMYLFKQTTGDFQMAVHVNAMDANNFHGAGIMARLFNAANGQSGLGGAHTETSMKLVDQQAVSEEVRRTINSGATTIENSGIANTWLLMQRVNSTNFLFFGHAGTNTNAWVQLPNSTLTLSGAAANAAMEAGIFEQMLSSSPGATSYDHFMLDGPGIVSPVGTPPPPAPGNAVATLNNDLSITLTWNADDGAGHPTQSLVVASQDAPVTFQPNYGWSLAAAGTYPFGSGQRLGGSNYLVYLSSNPAPSTNLSATVTGLNPGHLYYFSVYTFTGTGATKVFNETQPRLQSISDGTFTNIVTAPSVTLPLGGIASLQVTGNLIAKPSVDLTQYSTVTGNPNIAYRNGIITGLATSTNIPTQVIFSLDGTAFTNVINVTVRPAFFTDNFASSHDYTLNGVAGTGWDGIHNDTAGDIPDSHYPLDPGATNYGADANITSPGVLTVNSENAGWEAGENTGWFLFKRVAGDFQTAVHLHSFSLVPYNMPGLLARGYRTDSNAVVGAPFETNNAESFISWIRFDTLGIGTYARLMLNDGNDAYIQSTIGDQGDGQRWLLMQRTGTTYTFFQRANATDPWIQASPVYSGTQTARFLNRPMEVGVMTSPFNASFLAVTQFDTFMLDTVVSPILTASNNQAGAVVVSWQNTQFPVFDWQLEQSTNLQPNTWTTNSGARTTNGSVFSVTVPDASPATLYFRLQGK